MYFPGIIKLKFEKKSLYMVRYFKAIIIMFA